MAANGRAVCWGGGAPGPVPDVGLSDVACATSSPGVFGLGTDGSIVGWGSTSYDIPAPAATPSDPFVQLQAGDRHWCGLHVSGA
jgi:hypothetical protein